MGDETSAGKGNKRGSYFFVVVAHGVYHMIRAALNRASQVLRAVNWRIVSSSDR